jgi:sugar phosphate isomerase/epimerase
MKRRDFINTTLATTLVPAMQAVARPLSPQGVPAAGFSVKILATNWGYRGTMDQLCADVKQDGYDGLELWWTDKPDAQKEMVAALKKYGLEVGFLCGGSQPDFGAHLTAFKKAIDGASNFKELKPLYINCHSGRDYFSYEQNKTFIDYTTQASAQSGIPIYHETHRGRMLFAAHIARNFMEQNPALRLTLDISHWCNVHETLLQDQSETVALALSRTGHIHARIGHAEGPQVNDPRAPEWEAAVKAHLGWWDTVVAEKKKNGQPLTILTEFGPPHYLPTVPYTNQPLADQWAINVYMMRMLRERYI